MFLCVTVFILLNLISTQTFGPKFVFNFTYFHIFSVRWQGEKAENEEEKIGEKGKKGKGGRRRTGAGLEE